MKFVYMLILTFLNPLQHSKVFCGNVLVLCPMCTRSHKNIIEAMIEGLAGRNHSISVVSSYKTPINSPNIRDIIIMDGFDPLAHRNTMELRSNGVLGNMDFTIYNHMLEGCHTTYQNQEFINLLSQTFDLIIIDAFFNHCLHPIAHKLKTPVIRSSPLPVTSAMAMQSGIYLPSSFVPDNLLPFGEKMNFFERTVNLIISKLLSTVYILWCDEHAKISRQYLGANIPSLAELDSDISMTLVNSHFSINKPRPTMPAIVEIGGVHCRSGRPLPNGLEEFVSGSENGVILFSLGSIFKSEHMPEETRKTFVNVFSRLKQRVLWKWDFGEMSDLPSNVKLSKWLPIQDILAHPNTKLFITHGGLLSTQEAIYHGVPMVGIPLFTDQDSNVNCYVDAGIAVFLEILNVQEKDISDAIDAVLNNPEYKNNIETLSVLFRDQPQSALDTAVFWSEYVMRHKGAPQLRSAARDLNFIQYHSLDVIAFLSTLLFGSLFVLFMMAKKLWGKLIGRNPCTNNKHKKLI